jgi:hypothetical protein
MLYFSNVFAKEFKKKQQGELKQENYRFMSSIEALG